MAAHIVISGASGLIGRALARSLQSDGIAVTALVRRVSRGSGEAQWDPERGELDPAVLAGADAVVALGGASVGRLPWTRGYQRTLINSRLDSTRTLVTALRALGSDAPALVSASAVGFYGSAPGETLTEQSPAGDTFLARLCVAWEAEARRAEDQTRVALLRTTSSAPSPVNCTARSGFPHPPGRCASGSAAPRPIRCSSATPTYVPSCCGRPGSPSPTPRRRRRSPRRSQRAQAVVASRRR